MNTFTKDRNFETVIYYIDYEGCPMECTKEEYEAEQERLNSQAEVRNETT